MRTLVPNPDRTRLCRRCGTFTKETDFRTLAERICPACVENQVPAAMPLMHGPTWDRYDTARAFAGYRVWRVYQGESRAEYETETRSPRGECYAFAEATLAFLTKTTNFANLLVEEFPRARIWTRGDDGRCVVLLPVEEFPALAKRAGIYRKRVLSEEQRARLKEASERTRFTKRAA